MSVNPPLSCHVYLLLMICHVLYTRRGQSYDWSAVIRRLLADLVGLRLVLPLRCMAGTLHVCTHYSVSAVRGLAHGACQRGAVGRLAQGLGKLCGASSLQRGRGTREGGDAVGYARRRPEPGSATTARRLIVAAAGCLGTRLGPGSKHWQRCLRMYRSMGGCGPRASWLR